MGIKTEMRIVTPEQARVWLQRNINRHLRASKVLHLAECITNGTWRTTHQGIAFFTDGSLADGQHRLAAIAHAGQPVQILVTTGMTKAEAEVVDYQLTPRQPHDVFRMASSDEALTSRRCVAMVRILIRELRALSYGSNASVQEVQHYYTMHRRYIDPVLGIMPAGHARWGNAYLGACYVAALAGKGATIEQLSRFHSIVSTGVYDTHVPGESAALLLRNAILTYPSGFPRDANAFVLVRKAQRAIELYAHQINQPTLRDPKRLLWPAPSPPWDTTGVAASRKNDEAARRKIAAEYGQQRASQMHAARLLKQLRELFLQVVVDGTTVKVRPESHCPQELLDDVQRHKDALIQALSASR